MNRKEFLSVFGVSAAVIACGSCLGSCNPLDSNIPTAPTNVDFTLDLTASGNTALNNVGGSVYHGGIIIAHTPSGTFVAVSQACTHAGTTVSYDVQNNQFYCPSHGSTFSVTGAVTRGPAGSSLARYNTALSGTSLRVYS
jgi:cytochrome b6-f complex iron-sulfur subunit